MRDRNSQLSWKLRITCFAIHSLSPVCAAKPHCEIIGANNRLRFIFLLSGSANCRTASAGQLPCGRALLTGFAARSCDRLTRVADRQAAIRVVRILPFAIRVTTRAIAS